MTEKTRDELVLRAAKLLALIEPGEAPSAEDYNSIDGLLDPLIEQLSAESIYYIDNPDEIDSSAFEPLARLLANTAGPDFGSAINEAAQMRDEKLLRKLSAAKASNEVLKAKYF